jgi:O-Antigen ligase
MKKTFIDQLLGFLLTPYGIIGVAIGVLTIVLASRSRPAGWMLFSFCCFAASLNKFQDRWVQEPPALLFPLQQIRSVGRPLTIVLLAALVILALMTQASWRRWILPTPIKYLIAVQSLILFKTLLYGSVEFAMLSAITFGGVIFMLHRGPGRWLQDDKNFGLAARSISIAVFIFIVINSYQYAIDRYAITFHHGRFLGTTGNPQHAALLLASTIPCLMFLIQSNFKWNFAKFSWGVLLIVVMYFLLLTGSRTGLLMGATSILLFYRNNGRAWLRLLIGLAIVTVIFMTFSEPQTLSSSSNIDATVSDRFSSTNDTRGAAWNGMWQGFTNNLFFGVPLEGERMGYGENSWLAVASNLGLVGFIPMLMMGWECLKLMWQMDRLSNQQPYYFLQSSTVIAGLGSLLVGSLFECFLVGNITFALFAFLTYLLMGAYLIEVDRARTYYMQTAANSLDRSQVYQ